MHCFFYWESGGFCLLKSKLGGYAPEWVAMLQNRAVPDGCFGGKIAILGGFAPENSTVPMPPKLGGHAPVHPNTPHNPFHNRH